MIVKQAHAYMWAEEKEKREGNAPPHWNYLEIMVYGKRFVIVFEFSRAWQSDLIRQWMIDGNTETGVPWKWDRMEGTVTFDCSNNQCGKRAFEHDSISWEFLFKPLNLHWFEFHNKRHYNMMGVHEFKNMLKNNRIPFEVVKEGRY